MLKAAHVTVRVKPATKKRLEALASATRRSKFYVIEEALEQYLKVNEWQIEGIAQALAEAEKPEAVLSTMRRYLPNGRQKKGRIKWLGAALNDLDQIEAYIGEDHAAAAAEVVYGSSKRFRFRESSRGSAALVAFPAPKELVVRGLPYIVPYRVKDDVIQVLRVYHTSRKWPKRL